MIGLNEISVTLDSRGSLYIPRHSINAIYWFLPTHTMNIKVIVRNFLLLGSIKARCYSHRVDICHNLSSFVIGVKFVNPDDNANVIGEQILLDLLFINFQLGTRGLAVTIRLTRTLEAKVFYITESINTFRMLFTRIAEATCSSTLWRCCAISRLNVDFVRSRLCLLKSQ